MRHPSFEAAQGLRNSVGSGGVENTCQGHREDLPVTLARGYTLGFCGLICNRAQ